MAGSGREWRSTVTMGSPLSGKDPPSQESYHMVQRLAEAGEGEIMVCVKRTGNRSS
jgi:hypothetical protein